MGSRETPRNQRRSPFGQEKNPFKEENTGSHSRWPKGPLRNQERNPFSRGTKPAFEEENPFAPEKTHNRFQGRFQN
jgi:translation initiation factor IF-2